MCKHNNAFHSDSAASRRLFRRSLRSLCAGERGRWASKRPLEFLRAHPHIDFFLLFPVKPSMKVQIKEVTPGQWAIYLVSSRTIGDRPRLNVFILSLSWLRSMPVPKDLREALGPPP